MPVYEIEHPKTGQKIRLEGEGAPTDSDIREAFASIKMQPKDGRTPSYDNRVTDRAEIERSQKEFLKGEGTLGTRLRNTSAGDMVKNAALELPRLAQEVVTVPLSSAKKGAYGIGALAKTGGALIRGKSVDEALQAGTGAMSGYTPIQGPLEPSMVGEATGYGIEKGINAAENATGNTGFAKAGIEATADIAGLVGGGRLLAKSGRSLADLGRNTAGKVANKLDLTPESLARSALKPYIGESAARQAQATKGLKTAVADENAVARMPQFLKKNLAEMEEIAGRQDVLLSDKGDYLAPISEIRKSLQETIDQARETPGTADAAASAAERVLDDITKHPKYDAATDSIPLATMQNMKRNIWRKLREGGTFNKDAVPGLQDAMWDSATGMNKVINKYIPEMATENSRYGELANVNKLLKRAVDRNANNNIIPLRAVIQLVKGDAQGFTQAAGMWALDHPTFKMYIAQRMARSGSKPSPKAIDAVIEAIKVDIANGVQSTIPTQKGDTP